MESEKRFLEYKRYIEQYLESYIHRYDAAPQKELYSSMMYSLMAGGKRLRPILVFEFCHICGGDWKTAAPFAAALEMIHTYSLIHDDLPCMDNDDFRRGKPTNHKVYGEGIAVLAGDALLTDAFAVAASIKLADISNKSKAICILAENAGSDGMVGGQVLDIQSEHRVCNEQEVLDIQKRKTGALIKAACMLGAIAAGANETQLSKAGEFAEKLGLAFQIRDDMLDVIGTSEELGKSVGTDSVKNTFVRLYGLDKCNDLVNRYTAEAIGCLECFSDTGDLIKLAESMTTRRN